MSRRFDESALAVARVYARSMLVLAREGGTEDALGEELAGLVEVVDRLPDLERYLSDPLVDPANKSAALEKALRGRADDLLVDGLQVLNRKGRLGLVRGLAEAYRRELEVLRGEVDVEVATAVPLTDDQRERLRAAASRHTGLTARLVEEVDERLMGGMVLRIGDRKIDKSVIRNLHRLGERLADRASREIQSGKSYFTEAD